MLSLAPVSNSLSDADKKNVFQPYFNKEKGSVLCPQRLIYSFFSRLLVYILVCLLLTKVKQLYPVLSLVKTLLCSTFLALST